ncbi:probable cytochrome P450 6a13 [Halyomorpha halys]|uniref:probable cytochrome P450 6a13 n=1 Tax=Halyomorpha halys TaxID=286706 RepID=UPI0006D4F61F
MFQNVLLLFTLFIGSLIFALIKWAQERNKYWSKRNINCLKPKLFVGNLYDVLLGRKNMSEAHQEVFNAFPKDDVVGFYDFIFPRLLIRDPKLVEQVMKNDFSYFVDRAAPAKHVKDPLSLNLFSMCGNQWRFFRQKLSPAFTTGKLRYMFDPLAQCGNNMMSLLESNVGKEVDMKEVTELFAMDVIGSCAFGIDPGVIQNPNSSFRKMGKTIFEFSALQQFRFAVLSILPNLAVKLNFSFFKSEVVKYYCDIILNTLEYRKKHAIERNDFIQMMLQLQSKGKIDSQTNDPADDYLKTDKLLDTVEFQISDEILIGSAFGFLSAAFHTTSSALTYALYELTKKPEILEKTRQDIKQQIAIHGDINYDSLKSMTYLDKVLKETLRLHPGAPSTLRVCTKEYKFPNGLTLLPGDSIIIPIYALQRDPNYFSNPLSFNPDRFDEPLVPGTYIPFGDGPRICIGMRFAMLEMKFALSKLLLNYNIQLSKSTETPRMSPRGFLNIPLNGVKFLITKI